MNETTIISAIINPIVKATLTPNGVPILQKLLIVIGLFSVVGTFFRAFTMWFIDIIAYIIGFFKWMYHWFVKKEVI